MSDSAREMQVAVDDILRIGGDDVLQVLWSTLRIHPVVGYRKSSRTFGTDGRVEMEIEAALAAACTFLAMQHPSDGMNEIIGGTMVHDGNRLRNTGGTSHPLIEVYRRK